MKLGVLVEGLKPTDEEIARLAAREVDPAQAASFEPIARGPAWALAALAGTLLLALPAILARAAIAAGKRVVRP